MSWRGSVMPALMTNTAGGAAAGPDHGRAGEQGAFRLMRLGAPRGVARAPDRHSARPLHPFSVVYQANAPYRRREPATDGQTA